MVCIIIVIVLVVIQEIEIIVLHNLADFRISTQHLCGIAHILVGIHHLRKLWYQVHTHADVGVNAGSDAVTAAGFDDDNAVGTLGTIDGSTVLQY